MRLKLYEQLQGFSKANLYFNLWNRAIYLWPDRIERLKQTISSISSQEQKIKFLADVCKMKSLVFNWHKSESFSVFDDKNFKKVRRYF